jgi:hypothetical protein
MPEPYARGNCRGKRSLALQLRSVIVFVVAEQFLRVVEPVDSGLAVVQVRWWDPFAVAVLVFAGGPALFGDCVVGAAGAAG